MKPIFSQRHYEFLAKELRLRYKLIKVREKDNGSVARIEFQNFISQLCMELEIDNKKFDSEKFKKVIFKD